MNKIFQLSLLLGASVAFAGCAGEEDNIFSQSAAERLNAASELYSSRLEAQPNGWVMQLYPTTDKEAPFGNGYLVLVDFNKDRSVKAAMNNILSGNMFMEDSSSWEVITDNGPVLTFNTYNKVIHAFSNPEDVPSTGTQDHPKNETGVGIGGDYEFVIVQAPEDASYMLLKGKKRGTYNLLTPMEQGVKYSDYINEMTSFQKQMFPSKIPTFDVIHFGDSIYKMEGADDGIPNIYPYNLDGVLNESFNPFLVTKNGSDYFLRFRDPKVYGTTSVQEFRYNAEKDQFQMVTKNGKDFVVNENFYISGDDPLRFFNETATLAKKLKSWRMTNANGKSESFKTVYDNVATAFRSKGITLNMLQFKKKDREDFYQIGISFRNGLQTVIVWYDYTYAKDDTGITLNFSAPSSTPAQTLLTRVPEARTLLDIFSQKFTITRDKTAFDLNSIKLVSAMDANQWFVLSLM